VTRSNGKVQQKRFIQLEQLPMQHKDETSDQVEKRIEGGAMVRRQAEEIVLSADELAPFKDDPELYAYIKEHPAAARLFMTCLEGVGLVDPHK
jgi:hypothetical protein